MKKKGKFTIVFTAAALLLSGAVYAGNLDQTLAPTNPATAMFTVEDIYQRLLNGTTATKRVGPFAEPGAGPASTGHTLDDVYNLIGTRAFVPKTGQITSYAAGDDGTHQKGVANPSPRFIDNSNGTVTDNLTGLMWMKNANAIGTLHTAFDNDATPGDGMVEWQHALDFVAAVNAGTYACGVTTAYTDWRLPNRFELESLLDLSQTFPALPAGHPFGASVQNNWYWTSTTYAYNTINAWSVSLLDGYVRNGGETDTYYVWPVRGGQ